MKILIIIPARKGSVRLKKKNKRIFNKKPLIEHSINFAKKLKITPYILVSTNDDDILDIGKKSKVLVPWKRPENISKRNSKSISFTMHAIKWFEKKYGKLDTVILMQPTSPYRSTKTFYEMYKKYLLNKNSIVSVSKILKKQKKKFFFDKINNRIRNKNSKLRNFIPININGNMYINSVSNLKRYKDFVNEQTIPYIINNKKELIDIDTMEDFNKGKKLS